jgi:hypothetical protein
VRSLLGLLTKGQLKYLHINNDSTINKSDGKGIQEEGDRGTKLITEWKNGCE